MLDTTFKVVQNSLGDTLFGDLIDHIDEKKIYLFEKIFF